MNLQPLNTAATWLARTFRPDTRTTTGEPSSTPASSALLQSIVVPLLIQSQYLIQHSDRLAEWNSYLRSEVVRLKGDNVIEEQTPEAKPEIDGMTGIAYSHDYRIINDTTRGGALFRYRWERRGTPKKGESTVWVLGGISELLNLFRSWEMRGQYVYTYIGEGIVEAETRTV